MMLQLKLLVLTLIWWSFSYDGAVGDPQNRILLNSGCSSYNASNLRSFFAIYNDTFSNLRIQISSEGKHFATAAQEASGGVLVYSLFQCRNYLSKNDCLACFSTATTKISNNCAGNGGRIIYDGCFFRYESERFYEETTGPGNGIVCNNKTAKEAIAFGAAGQQALLDLKTATPKIEGFFAATKTQVVGGGAIYATAQCVETATENDCLYCLTVGCLNLPACLPNTDGRAYDAGCFMRYSETPFFADNQTVDITPYLKQGKPLNMQEKILIGVGSAVTALLMCIITWCFICKISIRQVKFQLTTKNDKDIEAFLKNHGALSHKRYKFSEVKKMTNSFKVKLGQGGFGAVYKGKLFNGCSVAVKILNASKGNGEEFINEVASISRTSHVNVVALLGFCFEGRKKALIYEFMPNGSLDKFIYNKGPETIASLDWKDLYQIAKGIARGLEYLHRGCTTRILHFDIKPHNILLDENFCPKISDFGLAKLCHRKESIISMSDARGTMGYVAPEVCNRHFGGVSHKSDVYSYGMMLLEMVGGRKNINAEASHTSEIFFPHWVYTKLQLGSDLRPDGVIVTDTEEEEEIARRMTIVGLWCIQTFPSDRPTMSRVIEMLEGSMNSLEIPPKPLLSSPTRSESKFST